MDVADWLRSLGLGHYETTFRDNAIGMDILTELTENDLAQFGVLFGDRKRLLKAIASLGSTEAAPKPPIAIVPTEPKPDAAERRQLTVMFCDLVGSTAISARFDPEDLRSIIGVYHRCCADCIERGGGFVAKYMGDGVLAYFGYPPPWDAGPQGHRRAGASVGGDVPQFGGRPLRRAAWDGSPLRVRVGIATG